MGANFEINILTKKYACSSFAKDLLQILGVREITSLRYNVAKDWFFTESVPIGNASDGQTLIESGNILCVEFFNRDNVNCGMFVSMENGMYQYSLWCACLNPALDRDEINMENCDIYESLYHVIAKWIELGALENYVMIAMGVELFWNSDLTMGLDIHTAKNVCAWIVSPSHRDWIGETMPGYTKHRGGCSYGEIWEKRKCLFDPKRSGFN